MAFRTLLSFGVAGSAATAAEGAYTFASIGDWGGAALGSYHLSNAKAVAAQMGKTAKDVNAQFVVNTGDNFYYCGVRNITDDQFKTDFEDIYTDKSLYVPWYGVLGNHDYAFDVESQLRYQSPNADRWKLPSRYFTKRVQLSGSQYMTMVFLDTNPCVTAYRADDPKGWDPCSGEFGDECNAGSKCLFHDHVMTQDCSAQYKWLDSTLAAIDKNDWVIAAGHHPANEITEVNDLTALLLSHNVRLYINGHTHTLTHYRMDGRNDIDFLTSGAGCMVHTHDQDVELDAVEGHSRQDVFDKRTSGFTVHTFSEDFSKLTTQLLDAEGNELHSFDTMKTGSGPAPGPSPPSPTPPPPSPSSGSCEDFGCGSYKKSHPCQCNRNCKYHKDCCADYDEKCHHTDAGDEELLV